MKSVAILSVGSPGSIATLKVLKDYGYKVHGIDIDRHSAARKLADTFELRNDLESRGISHLRDYDFVLSSTIEEFPLIEKSGATHLQPKEEVYESCRNKLQTSKIAFMHDVNHPKTVDYWPGNDWSGYVVKPMFGRGSRGLHISNKPVSAFAHFAESTDKMIVQELILGREFNVDGIALGGSAIGWFAHYSDRMRGGITTRAETFASAPVDKFVKLVAEKFKLHGLFNIGGMVDANGKIWLIEINPRISPGIIIGKLAGANPVFAWEQFISGQEIDQLSYSATPGVIIDRYFEEKVTR